MRTVSAFRSRFVYQAAAVVLLAGMSAACSSARLSEPFFTGSTDNQRQIIGNGSGRSVASAGSNANAGYQPMPPAVNSASVSRSDLLPPPPGGGGYQSDASYQQVAYAPAAATTAAAGWTAAGGKVVTLGPSDTLDNLAAKYGVPQDAILASNQLTGAGDLRSGRSIIIPRRSGSSYEQPVMTTTAAYAPEPAPPVQQAPAMAAAGGTYVVQPGDTLFGVARRTGVNVHELAAANGLNTASGLRIGQTLKLTPGANVQTTQVASLGNSGALGAPERPLGQLRVDAAGNAVAAAPAPDAAQAGPKINLPPPAETVAQGAVKAPAMPTIPAQGASSQTTVAAVDTAVDAASSDGKSFRWPVRGRIISGFGTKPNGERNDGINLAVPEGTSVKAVETGTVIYAGNELEGYGNLVLVRHADGWVSAYAHNKELLVKRGDKVQRGQTVSTAGMTGSVSSPQVHFELRRGSKPVNPMDYLAGA